MQRKRSMWGILLLVLCLTPARAGSDVKQIARCQKKIARAGARFANRVINGTLKCTNAISECQIQCEQGVFGPPCETNPPPCCDSGDPGSNQAFGDCMAAADELCLRQSEKIDRWEINKQQSITSACELLTQEELCGAQQPGLHFSLLNAGCLALDPGYVCDLPSLINCVGGPLQQQLLDQISAVLSPRTGDAVAALGLEAQFPGIPVARKVKDQVAAGKVDIWAFDGTAGDQILVAVRNQDDNDNSTANLSPVLTLLEPDGVTPVADTIVRSSPCPFPNPCGGDCPIFKRTLPFTGTFNIALTAQAAGGCSGGGYKMIVISPGGAVPTLMQDDIDAAVP